MTVDLGVKSDAIEYRYSHDWLFGLMEELGIRHLQLGSMFEMYSLPDRYFARLRERASSSGVRITSCFTSHRELGGLLQPEPDLYDAAKRNFRRYIEIGRLVGARSVGANPGSILRDRMSDKTHAGERYFAAMDELRSYAAQVGLEVLTLEPMSSTAEPPTSRDEISYYMERLNPGMGGTAEEPGGSADAPARVPVYICSDITHGLTDQTGSVVESNLELFEHAIPWMWEFHFKNTDSAYNGTFGFGPGDVKRGIVDLAEVARIISRNRSAFPGETLVGYLELPGPKLGRDSTDPLLEGQIREAADAVRRDFFPALELENRGT